MIYGQYRLTRTVLSVLKNPQTPNKINGSQYQEAAELLRKIRPRMREECCYNCREKYIVDRDGCAVILERIVTERPIFNPEHVELLRRDPAGPDWPVISEAELQAMTADEWEHYRAVVAELENMPDRLRREALADMAIECASNATEYAMDHGGDMYLRHERENRERAARRARRKVSDYVMAEYDFKYFITLTLDGRDFARCDINTAVKKLNTWLKNRVQRCGLKYIIVPEYHADGESLHFHGFINDALRVSDSGCVVAPGYKKPIKRETARRYGVDLRQCHTVYNLPDWLYGYTTAIELYGEKEAAAAYIAKYITKQYQETDGDRTKIGGRYYWHSNNLREPVCRYCNAEFETWPGDPFDTPGGQMKIEYFKGGKPHVP